MKQTLSPILCLLFLAAAPNANGRQATFHPFRHSNQHIVSLTAESTGWSAELYWTGSFDKDLVGFSVQRSADGMSYEDIVTYARYFLAAGDSFSFREQDNDPMPGENFYRIRFTLSDGEQVFTERRKLYFKEIPAFEIFPNPTGRQVNLLMKKFRGMEVEVLVFDGIGERVFYQHLPVVDDGLLRIELDSMNPGMYSVSVIHKGKTYTRRLAVTGGQGS